MKKNERVALTIPMPVRGMDGSLMTPIEDVEERWGRILANDVAKDVMFMEFTKRYFPRIK